MKTMLVLFLFFCASLIASNTTQASSAAPGSLEMKLAHASSNDVAKVVIFYFPEDILLELAMTPKDLEEAWRSMVVLRNFQRFDLKTEFLTKLKDSGFRTRSGEVGDTRLGCVFFDQAGKRLLSIYFDVSGNGSVDNTPVASNGKFREFLREKFRFR
jgi:hypothetical protein